MENSVTHPHLIADFIQAMEEIGAYGHTKYGQRPGSFTWMKERNMERGNEFPRVNSRVIIEHIHEHAASYEDLIPHDFFGDLEHQLAAIAYNAMMEFYFLRRSRGDMMTSDGGSRPPVFLD